MDINEVTPWRGDIQIVTMENGKPTSIETFPNMIMTDGRDMLANALLGIVTDAQIKYLGIGNSTTAVAVGQHTLVNELTRVPLTSSSHPSSGVSQSLAYVASFQANFTIEEIAWFAGENATASANTGIMVARTLWHKDKNAGMTLQITRNDTIG